MRGFIENDGEYVYDVFSISINALRDLSMYTIAIFEYSSFPVALYPQADKMLYDAEELTLDFRALLSPRTLSPPR